MAAQRTIFIVNIDEGSDSQGLFEAMYDPLIKNLKQIPTLNTVTLKSVIDLTDNIVRSTPKESVLLCVNEFIAKQTKLHELIKEFARRGGLVLLACLFSSFTKPVHMHNLFENLGLPWKHAHYYRTTFGLTETGKLSFGGADIEETYSAKAVQLSGVIPEEQLYKPVENARTQSMVFAPSAADPNMALAAFRRIGNGAVAYVGDVNAETGSDKLIVALCLAKW